jgi:hypothetical protein
LSVDHNAGEIAGVKGLPGRSDDGSIVYFVAEGRLTSEPRAGCVAELSAEDLKEEESTHEGRCRPKAGGDNLYLSEPDPASAGKRRVVFIATLSDEDLPDWSVNTHLTSSVSSNGDYLAFMSDMSLTGYDNRDANSGASDEEVFLYEANSARLKCISCNPTGARPLGALEAEGSKKLIDGHETWAGRWLAGNIPGWTGMDITVALYQSRYLSDDGRLFFNSPDVLVPQDTNGADDVYEYDPVGVGGCTRSEVSFDAGSDGCVNLISAGTSANESAFMDASLGGSDVFFLTASKLAPQDYDTALDVYDAHVCSPASPCFASPVSPPACTSGDSCKKAPSPQPEVFGAPASATFAGSGNVVTSAAGPAVGGKSLTRAQKLARALSLCARDRAKKKRQACKRRARKQYGAKQPRKANATKRGHR